MKERKEFSTFMTYRMCREREKWVKFFLKQGLHLLYARDWRNTRVFELNE
jgi:hypothetical protein